MTYYVYILESLVDGTMYKGYSHDYVKRLKEHDACLSRYTSRKLPWKLIYVGQCANITTALIREKQLKRANNEYLKWLLSQESNLVR